MYMPKNIFQNRLLASRVITSLVRNELYSDFGVIGNKYIIDSALPESSSFTLVDSLHGVTLFFIIAIIGANAFSLKLIKKDNLKKAYRFDTWASIVTLIVYTILNVWLIWGASRG